MRTFSAFGFTLPYDEIAQGERIIENPMGALTVKFWPDPTKVVEIGNVLAHCDTLTGALSHLVADLFEVHPRATNIHGSSIDFSGKNVISISTLEHFDMPDYGNTNTSNQSGCECLQRIISTASKYFITIPSNYNKQITDFIRGSNIGLAMFKQVEPKTWTQLEVPDWDIQYGLPFEFANAVVVIANCEWCVT